MFRYLAGLVLVQLITVGVFVLNADAEPEALALRAGVPALGVALLAALWFRTLSRVDGERDLARTRVEHERERERLRGDAERERVKITRAAERTVRREERRAGRRANLKVGLAFGATAGLGVLFVISELVTLGLLTLTTGGGALGGYLMRWRQTRGDPRVGGTVGAVPMPPTGVPGPPEPDDPSRHVTGEAALGVPPGAGARSDLAALPAPVRADSPARTRGGRRRSAPGRAGV